MCLHQRMTSELFKMLRWSGLRAVPQSAIQFYLFATRGLFFFGLHKMFDFLSFCPFPRNGKCKKIEEGQECLQGMRLRQYHMLCGALLRVWKRVSDVVSDITSSSILQIVRLKTKQHNKQVGQYIFADSCDH